MYLRPVQPIFSDVCDYMLSKNNIKFIKSLSVKKYRNLYKQYVIEGDKMVTEALYSGIQVNLIVGMSEWKQKNEKYLKSLTFIETDEAGLKKVSSLTHPNQVLAVINMPEYQINYNEIGEKISLVLDGVSDPGNMGTIIRTADWFGIENIICSEDTVDVYNPKVVQATMGSVFRVKVFYTDLKFFLKKVKGKLPVYGMFLEGGNIYLSKLNSKGLIVFGNESKGISDSLLKYITEKLTIPSCSAKQIHSESLNVAVSAAITCAEFTRRFAYSK